ncbi:MAG: diacylglycerol kinase family protein [Anaerolineales bacterium]|nr:diacylglycerol kinase family protein [Anaerolineales bacterium]
MLSFFKSRWQSIRIAFEGVVFLFRTQKNAWIHASITVFVVLLGLLIRLNRLEWVLILLTMGVVWAAESFNTAMEVLVDFVSPEQQPMAKICKDVSAAGVLITAGISVLVGLLIFLPHIWRWLSLNTPWITYP